MAVSLEEDPVLSGLNTTAHSRASVAGEGVGAAVAPPPTPEQAAALHELQHRRGVVLVNVAKLRATAARVYALSTRSLTGAGDIETWSAEWKNLEADLLDIAACTARTSFSGCSHAWPHAHQGPPGARVGGLAHARHEWCF